MKWIFTTMLLVATIAANAQYVTYNHDSPKMNQISECLPLQELAGKYSGSGHFRSLVVFQYILHLLVIIRFCNGSSTVGGNHSGNGFRIEVHAVILGMNLLGENRGYCHYYESESFHCCFVFG